MAQYKLSDVLVFNTGKLDSNKAEYNGRYPFFTCSPETLSINTYAFDCEAVLLAGNNANAIYPVKYYKGKFNAYQRTYVITAKDNSLISLKWFYFKLKSIIDDLSYASSGTATKFLTKKILDKYEIDIPNIEEQYKISNFLWNLENKITLNTQTNQTLEQIAQAIFKHWFIDFAPVHAKANAIAKGATPEQVELAAMVNISGKTEEKITALKTENPEAYHRLQQTAQAFPSEFVESEMGLIPKGWEVKPLDKIANYQNGLALQKFRPENEDDFLPVVKIAELKQGYATGKEKASTNINPKCIIDNGDVIFSWSGSLVVDIWCGGKAALNQHLFKVTSEKYPKWLYYFYTKHHLIEFQHIASSKAVTMGHIKREHLSQAMCIVPPEKTIKSFKNIQYLLEKIIQNRLENNNLTKIRDELLPKLLSGEIEV